MTNSFQYHILISINDIGEIYLRYVKSILYHFELCIMETT
ncbi:hypothetical protein HMPREF0373_02755 [Eubacterium ramulus ATCC 29099]|uniref:Uncharacterized protein n=1 Tax=Eubacterium ramulus ATCC 29099 TaxID=1256908 RepID=U2QV86_EUBRA|nr:hypothetical protein HMPREF0373_02755 [Eubacterium ramulus ATCC 29099]